MLQLADIDQRLERIEVLLGNNPEKIVRESCLYVICIIINYLFKRFSLA